MRKTKASKETNDVKKTHNMQKKAAETKCMEISRAEKERLLKKDGLTCIGDNNVSQTQTSDNPGNKLPFSYWA